MQEVEQGRAETQSIAQCAQAIGLHVIGVQIGSPLLVQGEVWLDVAVGPCRTHASG
jgi:hypothetical protein